MSRFLPGLRALLTLGRELAGIRRELHRIADHLEGRASPATPLPDDLREPVSVSYTTGEEFERAFLVEQQLGRTLGRAPTAEEITDYLDGVRVGQ